MENSGWKAPPTPSPDRCGYWGCRSRKKKKANWSPRWSESQWQRQGYSSILTLSFRICYFTRCHKPSWSCNNTIHPSKRFTIKSQSWHRCENVPVAVSAGRWSAWSPPKDAESLDPGNVPWYETGTLHMQLSWGPWGREIILGYSDGPNTITRVLRIGKPRGVRVREKAMWQ